MDLHWRNTQRPARFFSLDARSALPILLVLFHMRLSTLVFAILVMIAFYIAERMGLTFESALRALRCYILGQNRPATRRQGRRHWVDFE